jgi:hypothetical protein
MAEHRSETMFFWHLTNGERRQGQRKQHQWKPSRPLLVRRFVMTLVIINALISAKE